MEAEQQLCAGLVLPKSMFILDEVGFASTPCKRGASKL